MFQKIYRSMRFLTLLTIVLVMASMLSAFYVTLSQQNKKELVNETKLIASIYAVQNNLDGFSCKNKFYITDKNGTAVYDGGLNPKIVESLLKNSLNNRILFVDSEFQWKHFTLEFYCVSMLADGNLLFVEGSQNNLPVMLIGLFIIALLSAIILLVFSSKIARAITNSIVAPFRDAAFADYSKMDHIYEEIRPLLSRLTNQDYEIKRQSDKAKSQKLQLQTVTSKMNEGLIILDKAGNILAMNRYAQDILCVEERDYKYKSLLTLPKSEKFSEPLAKASSGKNNDILFSSNGKTHQMFFTPVFENDQVGGMVILLLDISEKYRTEQIRREFSANVSHELKTPLTTIFGYAQIITNGIAKPEDVKGFAAKIEKESARLITLIDDIIALSNLEENGAVAEKETLHLKAITKEVFESLEPQASKKNVTLILDGSDTIVNASKRQMHELLFNLCDNAIKYNKEGGSVTVTLSNNKISVKDTGIGIPKDSFDRLFERFYRVDKSHSKKVNGTGLGLSIVKHIVQNNNAEISLQSELDKGSVFTVKFYEN